MSQEQLKKIIKSQEELDSLRFLTKEEMERLWEITERNNLITRIVKLLKGE